ncbi:MAG: glutaminase A [Verrucomicrobiales bacterium]|nr:glutaminase A [Verrucomicrobiales bacterium]
MHNTISQIIQKLHEKYQTCGEGALADYIPELTKANPDWFGISVFTTDGHCYEIGDCRQEFTIQSISKAFTFGMILDEFGIEAVEKRIGVEPSGEAFNSISLDPVTGRPFNPMINAGAITASGMIRGAGFDERFEKVRVGFSGFAGRELGVDESVYRSESATGFRNRAIANLLRNFNMLEDPVDEALEVYFKQCSILVNCRDLSVMAASLANGGINPLTKKRVLDQGNVEKVLSVMSTCGMYDYSGEWIFTVGLPAKSGVGGGIMGVLPGQLGVAVFSPLLDGKGNSVRGVKVFEEMSKKFNLHLFNYPVISDQVIRRIYRLSEAGSHRQRPHVQHEALREHGSGVTVIELQGDIFFTAMERVVRSLFEHAETSGVYVLDLSRAGLFDEATESLLFDVAKELEVSGKRLFLVDPGKKLKRKPLLDGGGNVVFYDEIDLALEYCEDEIIELHIAKPLVKGLVPFYEFDLFKSLTSPELSVVEGRLEMIGSKRGTKIIEQGGDPDHIFLLAKGSVSIFHQPGNAGGRGRRVNAFGPGVCFGDLALFDGSKRSADVWADEEIVCYTLSLESLQQLEREFPGIYQKIIKNILLLNIERLRRMNTEIGSLKV